MDPKYSLSEIVIGLISIGLTTAFTLWAWVVRSATTTAATKLDAVIVELKSLREEIHNNRLAYEKRFMRIESRVGLSDID